MPGIVHQTKEYRHGFGQSTSYTHPGNWNGSPDGVSMLKEPTKSCFRRHGVITGLSIAGETYDHITIEERHRHRYEYNNEYRSQLEAAGLKTSGINPDTGLVEIIEIENHPWFVGVQYHPEYKSTVANPHPLFVSFVNAANEHLKKNHTTI